MSLPKSSASIYSISPYIGGDVTPQGFVRRVVLASNENPYGPSELVKQVIRQHTSRIHCYPSGAANELREALGNTHGLDSSWIVTGNGSEDILHLLARTFVQPGDEVLISQHGFGVYKIATLVMGGIPVEVPRVNFKLNVEDVLARVTSKTKIFYLDHPGNPIAHYLTNNEIEDLLACMPSHVLVVFDSAYAEYMDNEDYHHGTKWVQKYPNVVMARTFSKAYGMANLRLGWLYAHPEILDPINRIRPPFNTTGLSQAAGIAALSDQEWIRKCVQLNKENLSNFVNDMKGLNIPMIQYASNFVMAYFEKTQEVYRYLGEKGLIVRPMGAYDLPQYLRITIGKHEEMQELIDVIGSCPHL
ncbi:MAG: histidinol-phosphate transaminase [Proteobacteria bacterium]|nr:histidinol-phosphate transaminase [Pseudomonadota bacterium]